MSNIFNKTSLLRKQKKINYFSPKIWRLSYLVSLNSVYHKSEKKIFSRSSVIPYSFLSQEVSIYTGKSWINRRINRWMVGYRFGNFTWNRKYALYKAKSKKKKKK